MAHIAHALPRKATVALYDYICPDIPVATNPLTVKNGIVNVPDGAGPGHGAEVNEDFIGDPLFVLE